MPQIRVTNNTKNLLDQELAAQKEIARALDEPLPSMAHIIEVLVIEGLASINKHGLASVREAKNLLSKTRGEQ